MHTQQAKAWAKDDFFAREKMHSRNLSLLDQYESVIFAGEKICSRNPSPLDRDESLDFRAREMHSRNLSPSDQYEAVVFADEKIYSRNPSPLIKDREWNGKRPAAQPTEHQGQQIQHRAAAAWIGPYEARKRPLDNHPKRNRQHRADHEKAHRGWPF